MTTRARLRSRHRKHKRRTYWRKLRRERGYFECGEPLTLTEIDCMREERLVALLPPSRMQLFGGLWIEMP